MLTIRLNNKTSSGPDEVPMFLLRRALLAIIGPVAHLGNRFFGFGLIPDHLNISEVVPVLKRGSWHNVDYNRPISVPNSFSKVLIVLF